MSQIACILIGAPLPAQVEGLIDRNWRDSEALKARNAQHSSLRRGGLHAAGSSRYWCIEGQLPDPVPEAAAVAAEMAQLRAAPNERSKWSKRLIEKLKEGVLVEVQNLLTCAALSSQRQPMSKEEMDAEFERIKV